MTVVSDRDHLLTAGEVSPASSYVIPGPSLEPAEQHLPKCDPRTPSSESHMRAEAVHERSRLWADLRPMEPAFLGVASWDFFSLYFFKYILLIMLLQLSQFFSLCPSPPSTLLPSSIPRPLSSCSWVMHICFLASPFPVQFLTSACLFCTYQLCFLFPVPLSPPH